jgi:hypothetical protein
MRVGENLRAVEFWMKKDEVPRIAGMRWSQRVAPYLSEALSKPETIGKTCNVFTGLVLMLLSLRRGRV